MLPHWRLKSQFPIKIGRVTFSCVFQGIGMSKMMPHVEGGELFSHGRQSYFLLGFPSTSVLKLPYVEVGELRPLGFPQNECLKGVAICQSWSVIFTWRLWLLPLGFPQHKGLEEVADLTEVALHHLLSSQARHQQRQVH